MDSTGWLLGSLVVSILVILFLIMKVKLNAAIALILGSIFMAAMAGLSMLDAIGAINSGFGSMLAGIGLPIGFGVILGQLVSDSGGARVIAQRLVKLFPASKAIYAISIAAYILAIPVFFDITFLILIPIGIALMKEIGRPIAYIVGAITIGAATAHTIVPPTPAPLAAAEIFGFDVGMLIAVGGVSGILVVILTTWVYIKVLDRGFASKKFGLRWDEATDQAPAGPPIKAQTVDTAIKAPSLGLSILPILVPLVAILTNTVVGMMNDEVPGFVAFVGDKTIAMLLGALTAYAVSIYSMGHKKTEKSATDSLNSLGVVLLITGAGGAFSAVISATGVADAIQNLVSGFADNVFLILLIAYLVGLILKQATGSGTVSALTSMAIMAPVATDVPLPAVFIALACLFGTIFGATVNDSGFWIVTKMSGLEVKGGIKTYTVPEMILSVIGIVTLLIVVSGYLIIT